MQAQDFIGRYILCHHFTIGVVTKENGYKLTRKNIIHTNKKGYIV